jgi:hypothetical protein
MYCTFLQAAMAGLTEKQRNNFQTYMSGNIPGDD